MSLRIFTRPLASAALFALFGMPLAGQAPDLKAVAHNLVQAGLVAPGDKVLVTGSVRDAALLEDIAIEAMKLGGQPMITIGSEQLGRRSYDDVPAQFDSQPQTLGMGLINLFNIQISVDVGESETIMAGVPAARIEARAKAGMPVTDAYNKTHDRLVSLGNGLYPTPTLAKRLGMPLADLTATFWRAAAVPAEQLRSKANALHAVFNTAKTITITKGNGTNFSFTPVAAHIIVSDGALTPERVAQGAVAASTWLPAGEFIVPAAPGTASGKLVIDRMLVDGVEVRGFTAMFSKGRVTVMTATSGLAAVKAHYDIATGARDLFGYIDMGFNPDAKFPLGTGAIAWMAPGAVTFGIGDNTTMGGTNASTYSIVGQNGGMTVKADGKVIVANGVLR